jgi:response regulator of citrate/malate metabolism
VGREKQTDGYRTCSDVSQCYKAQLHAQLLPMTTLKKVRDVIRKDQRLGVRAVAEEVNLDRESVRRILREELNMRKVCAKNGSKTAVR